MDGNTVEPDYYIYQLGSGRYLRTWILLRPGRGGVLISSGSLHRVILDR